MLTSSRWPRLLVAAILAVATGAGAQPSGITIELGDGVIDVEQASPGGTVALASVVHTPVGFSVRVESGVEVGQDHNGDGRVGFELGGPVPASSVWLAIDAASGRFATASPVEGAPFAFPAPLGLAPDPEGGPRVPAVDRPTAILALLVRPGAGIWRAVAADGGVTENTGVADGRIALLEPTWEPVIEGISGPGTLRPSDLLLVLDPSALALDGGVIGGLDDLP